MDGSAGGGGAGKGGAGAGGSAGAPTGSGGTSGAGAGGGGAGAGGGDAATPDVGGADRADGSGGSADGGRRDADATDGGRRDADGGGGRDGGVTKFVGNITTQGQVRSDLINFWDQITPENEGKWGSVEPNRNQMNWAGMDRIRDYARQHGIPYKQHTFVWGAQQPSWIGGLSESEQRAEVEEWIRLFCERYPDVAMIDVVNEPPPHTTPVYMNALGGAGSSGYDWIVQAFRWARQYCPNAILILNDYNTIEFQGDNNNIIDITNRIKAAGAPIDGVGAQAHGTANMTAAAVETFINRIASMTSLPVYITEYDLNIADDNRQREVMQSQFTMFWNNTNVKGITLWGYVSGATWLPNTGLMSSTGQQRPAMVWLMQFLGR
jgi:endo-1,4-beta-xylanase